MADKIEREERAKRRAIELEDQRVASQILEKERPKNGDRQARPPNHLIQHSPQRPMLPPSYPPPELHPPKRPDLPQQYYNGGESPRRQALAMPLPSPKKNNTAYLENGMSSRSNNQMHSNHPIKQLQQQHPIRHPPENLLHQFTRCNLDEMNDHLELGLPVDEVEERRMQEEKDAVSLIVVSIFICLFWCCMCLLWRLLLYNYFMFLFILFAPISEYRSSPV